MSMHHIRPHKLFSMVAEESAMDRLVTMKIPRRVTPEQPDLSLKLLELMAICACIRIVDARSIFEFGTFCGNTTLHVALNSHHRTKIWTLDADDATLESIGLMDMYRARAKFPLQFEGTQVATKIKRLRMNSHDFEAAPFVAAAGRMDLVLIDGDHSTKGVSIDTQNADAMVAGYGCVLWHDYRNEECPENTEYIDGLAHGRELFHILDSWLVMEFRGAVAARLKAAL
jgi:predicted O-methyltransferase YrrM